MIRCAGYTQLYCYVTVDIVRDMAQRQVLVVDEEHRAFVDPNAWTMHVWQNLLCAPASFTPNLAVLAG